MPQTNKQPLDAAELRKLIQGLSVNHVLKNCCPDYVDGFIRAALGVYDLKKIRTILQARFFIPGDRDYWEETYYQSASELSVAWHIKQKETQGLARNFCIEKKINPPKNVDDYFEVWDKGTAAGYGCTRVALEIKCPLEDSAAPFPGHITLQTAGRIPEYHETLDEMKEAIESGPSGNVVVKGKNPDTRMKDCLILAHEKFQPSAGVDDLNVLLLSCGDRDRMNQWHMCLYAGQELFTQESFEPAKAFSRVDLVVLSNLKYRHQRVRDASAWTLDNVLMLPILNPHGRTNLPAMTIEKGLGIFKHYRRDFAAFRSSSGLIVNEHSETQAHIAETLKLNHFVMEFLPMTERLRFFPDLRPAAGE